MYDRTLNFKNEIDHVIFNISIDFYVLILLNFFCIKVPMDSTRKSSTRSTPPSMMARILRSLSSWPAAKRRSSKCANSSKRDLVIQLIYQYPIELLVNYIGLAFSHISNERRKFGNANISVGTSPVTSVSEIEIFDILVNTPIIQLI